MAFEGKVNIKRMQRERLNARQPDIGDMKYSVIYFHGCNLACFFCFEQDKDPDGTPRQNLGRVDFSVARDFVLGEVRAGHPVKLSGGEVTLHKDAVLELLKIIKGEGGYAAIDTNGTNPDAVNELAPYLDTLGLDVKSTPDKIEFYTGRPRQLSYDRPLRTLQASKYYDCRVDFKRVLFEVSGIDDLEHFYPHASHAHWILKQARPFPPDRIIDVNEDRKSWITPINGESLLTLMDDFVDRHPEMTDNILAITGSSRSWDNYHFHHMSKYAQNSKSVE